MQTKFDIGQRVYFESAKADMPIMGTGEISECHITAVGITYNVKGYTIKEEALFVDVTACAAMLAMRAAKENSERQANILQRMQQLKVQFPVPPVVLGEFN